MCYCVETIWMKHSMWSSVFDITQLRGSWTAGWPTMTRRGPQRRKKAPFASDFFFLACLIPEITRVTFLDCCLKIYLNRLPTSGTLSRLHSLWILTALFACTNFDWKFLHASLMLFVLCAFYMIVCFLWLAKFVWEGDSVFPRFPFLARLLQLHRMKTLLSRARPTDDGSVACMGHCDIYCCCSCPWCSWVNAS